MSSILDEIERNSNTTSVTDKDRIMEICQAMTHEHLSSMKTATQEKTALRYAIKSLCDGFKFEFDKAVSNLRFLEMVYLILATRGNENFSTEIGPEEIDEVVYGRTLGSHFVEGLIESSETNRTIYNFLAINFNSYISLCQKYADSKEMKKKIERFYHQYQFLNLPEITFGTTLGDVLKSTTKASRKAYIPGVMELNYFGSEVEIANHLTVFLAIECMNELMCITDDNMYVDIYAQYELGDREE